MSEIRSIHRELIKRCKVVKLTPDEIFNLKHLGKYPRIGNDDIPVLCTNYNHKNRPSWFCYIDGYDLKDYIINVYLPISYKASILNLKETISFWDWCNRSWLLENTEIETYYDVLILDEFIEAFKSLNNKILRKYLTPDQILSLCQYQSSIKIEDDRAIISNFKGAL